MPEPERRTPITIDIASPPDREKLVAMLLIEAEQWAGINQERERLQLELYPRRDGKPWVIDFEDALASLSEARCRLGGR